MRSHIEGSRAIAETVTRCRPQVERKVTRAMARRGVRRHLFTPEPRTEAIAAIQAIADEDIRRYRLKRRSAGADSPSTPVNPAAVRGANGRTG